MHVDDEGVLSYQLIIYLNVNLVPSLRSLLRMLYTTLLVTRHFWNDGLVAHFYMIFFQSNTIHLAVLKMALLVLFLSCLKTSEKISIG